MRRTGICTGLVAIIGLLALPARALDLTDRLSLGGVLAGGIQCQSIAHGSAEDKCGSALPFQPQLIFNPTELDQLAVKLGFAAGNALNLAPPFDFPLWAADLADDVVDINGRDRSYLLTAWYKHTFKNENIAVTAGIIDATIYLDNNAYASNEYTQFMNDVFDNAPGSFVPSYDWGSALEWDSSTWSVRAVAMNVGGNDEGSFNYFGAQLAYISRMSFGEGTYRVLVARTSEDFFDPFAAEGSPIPQLLLSFDQQFGEFFGAFLRIGWQEERVPTDYGTIYSGGIDLRGSAWGRPLDNVGLGYAHLDGDRDLQHAEVAEIYYRFALRDAAALTADLQYMRTNRKAAGHPEGFIYGLRATVGF
jgi:porin